MKTMKNLGLITALLASLLAYSCNSPDNTGKVGIVEKPTSMYEYGKAFGNIPFTAGGNKFNYSYESNIPLGGKLSNVVTFWKRDYDADSTRAVTFIDIGQDGIWNRKISGSTEFDEKNMGLLDLYTKRKTYKGPFWKNVKETNLDEQMNGSQRAAALELEEFLNQIE